LEANITITQLMPTVSIGHIFGTAGFFANIALGASFLSSISASITDITGTLPNQAGSVDDNEAQLEQIKNDINTQANENSQEFKNQYLLFPSFTLTVGWMF